METQKHPEKEGEDKENKGGDDETERLKKELENEKNKTQEYKELAQRIQADFENYIKRSEAERRETHRSANQELVTRLLDVVDTMDLALKTQPKDEETKKILDGFSKVNTKLKTILSAEGLEEIKNNGTFNHDIHEAVETVEDPTKPDGTIVDVVQKGYTLKGKLIRTSKVIVIKNRGDTSGEDNRD